VSYLSECLADSPALLIPGVEQPVYATAATASTQFASEPASQAINGEVNAGGGWTTNGVSTGWLRVQFATAQTLTYYAIRRRDDIPARNPKDWTFEGSNDGTTFTVLDTRTNQTWPTAGATQEYTFANSTAYLYYRLNITANNGDVYLSVIEIFFGRFADVSGNNRHLNELRRTPTADSSNLVLTDPRGSVLFTGTGKCYRRNAESWMYASTSYTVEALIKTTTAGSMQIITLDDAGGTPTETRRRWALGTTTGTLPFFQMYATGGAQFFAAIGTVALNDGAVHHVAGVCDGVAKTATLYTDGAQAGQIAWSGSHTGAVDIRSPLTVGTGYNNNYEAGQFQPFAGNAGWLGYYMTALSPTRIAAHAAARTFMPNTTGAYWGARLG
jgi:hypothetical protein